MCNDERTGSWRGIFCVVDLESGVPFCVTLERVVGNFRRHSMMVKVDEREKCKDWNERESF